MLKLQAKFSNVVTSKRRHSARFSACFCFGGVKGFPPSVNNLFKGIPFSHEDKIHEQAHPGVIIARKENKGKFCLLFSLVLAGFRKGLSAENLLFRREGMSD